VDYKRNIADFYLKVNKIDLAIASYDDIVLNHPDDGFSYIGLAECYRVLNNVDQSFNALKKAFRIEDVPSDIKVSLLVNIISNLNNDTDIKIKAIELTEILIKLYPENPDINTIYANFLLQPNDVMGAKTYLERVLDVRKDKYAVWEQLVLIYNQLQDWKNCYSATNEAISYFPNQSFFYFFNGFSGFQLEKYNESLESFKFGLKLITKNDPLYKDYLTFLGESYHKTGNKKDAYATFDELLKVDSENIMVLNNYAYYLSIDDKNLDKAEKMSFVTITKEADNSTYLDTYAWILFRLKRYNEALTYIIKAVENNKDKSAVIMEHYGDILFFNDKKEKALEIWNEAILMGEGSPFLKQKIDEKKYIE
jgi:tetratricopeptide (TPR) repeat protein